MGVRHCRVREYRYLFFTDAVALDRTVIRETTDSRCIENAMKKLMTILLLIASPFSSSETFITKNFTIEIHSMCEEGNVTCDEIQFTLSVKGFESKKIVTGKTIHTRCADGVTPCAFQGYLFVTNDAKYFLYHSGVLEVVDKQDNPLLLEQGEWMY